MGKTDAKHEAVVAIDAGGTYFKSALVTMEGEIPQHSRFCIGIDSNGEEQSVKDAYQTIIRTQLLFAQELGLAAAGIAVDTPGPFDFENSASLMKHKFRSIYGIPLKPWLKEAAGPVPILFLHDSTAFMLGESWRGEAAGYQDAAGVMLGTGLGFACMKNGHVRLGMGGGPEISLYDRPFLGKTAEDYVSRRGITGYYKALTACGEEEALDVLEISRRAREGEEAARETFAKTGQYLGRILALVLARLETRCLVVGGQISKSFDLFGEELKSELQIVSSLEKIVRCGQPDDAHLLGCARAFWTMRL